MNFSRLAIREIHADFSFRFSTAHDLSRLKTSMSAGGMTTPVSVLPDAAGFRLIGGFSRYEAAVQLGWTTLDCWILEPETPVLHHLTDIVQAHALAKPLDLMEKARLLCMTDPMDADEAQRSRLFSLMEIPDKATVLNDFRKLAQWPQPVQDYLARTDLAIKQAMIFDGLDAALQVCFAQWARQWGVRPVELGAVIGLCLEISRRESVTAGAVFDAALSEASQCDNRSRMLTVVKEALSLRRFPRLTAYREAMQADGHQLKLSQGVSIAWDRSLEQPGIELKVRLHSMAAFHQFKDWLTDPGQAEILIRMIER